MFLWTLKMLFWWHQTKIFCSKSRKFSIVRVFQRCISGWRCSNGNVEIVFENISQNVFSRSPQISKSSFFLKKTAQNVPLDMLNSILITAGKNFLLKVRKKNVFITFFFQKKNVFSSKFSSRHVEIYSENTRRNVLRSKFKNISKFSDFLKN